jgi:hypothetical protein
VDHEARSLEGKRVLVIEDNYLIAEALCDLVRRWSSAGGIRRNSC